MRRPPVLTESFGEREVCGFRFVVCTKRMVRAIIVFSETANYSETLGTIYKLQSELQASNSKNREAIYLTG